MLPYCVHITKCLFHSLHEHWTTIYIFNLDHKDMQETRISTGKWILLDENGSAV